MKSIKLSLVFSLVFMALQGQAQLYLTSSATASFYSYTPVENIEAKSQNLVCILNSKTNDVAFQVANTSFIFQNELMQEHFNEKYMESEKYPKSSFAGKINEAVNYAVDGTTKVTVTGVLNIHGVEQKRTISGNLVVKGQTIQLLSEFKVKVADHKIEIPKIVTAKIAEEVEVKVDAILKPKG